MGSFAFVFVDKGVFNIDVLLHHLRSNQVGFVSKMRELNFCKVCLSLSCFVMSGSCLVIVLVFVLSGCFAFLTSYDCVYSF